MRNRWYVYIQFLNTIMPYISIESGKLTAEQKKQLIERLTATASEITHITVYLKSVISRPTIEVGDFTIYNDFVNDPRDFEKREPYSELTFHLHISPIL